MLGFKRLTPFSAVGSVAAELHRDWITAREEKLARRDHPPVCCFCWGMEALADVPGFESLKNCPELDSFQNANQRGLETGRSSSLTKRQPILHSVGLISSSPHRYRVFTRRTRQSMQSIFIVIAHAAARYWYCRTGMLRPIPTLTFVGF